MPVIDLWNVKFLTWCGSISFIINDDDFVFANYQSIDLSGNDFRTIRTVYCAYDRPFRVAIHSEERCKTWRL